MIENSNSYNIYKNIINNKNDTFESTFFINYKENINLFYFIYYTFILYLHICILLKILVKLAFFFNIYTYF